MRMLLTAGILVAQVVFAQAGDCRDPLMRKLSAITRYCILTGESLQRGVGTCDYDCLISKESIARPTSGFCPTTARQRLFNDNTREIVAN
jgi:hypothetical protein